MKTQMKKKMKKLINSALKVIVKIIAFIYPYKSLIFFRMIKSKLFTYWISSELKQIGNTSIVDYTVRIRGSEYISIGENTGIGARGNISAWDKFKSFSYMPEICIGNNSWIGEYCHITAINQIKIGNNVLIGKNVTITDNSHGKTDHSILEIAPGLRPLISKGPVVIEDNVWIGDKATILPGVKICKNAIIGANSVVTKDVGESCVVGGNPAKLLRKICG